MNSTTHPHSDSVATFRTRLLAAMMLVVLGLTIFGLYLAQRNVAATAERNLQENFQAELSSLHRLQELRHSALTERCRQLVAKPRIHAALEDNALDLLYPSAKDELRDLMEADEPARTQEPNSLHARFYRFLDGTGAVLPPPNPKDVGALTPEANAQLALQRLPETQQIGYLSETSDPAGGLVDEVMAVPIVSSETGEVISALIVGFKPFQVVGKTGGAALKSGIWVNNRLHLSSLPTSTQLALGNEIDGVVNKSDRSQNNFAVTVNGTPQLLFYKLLNPGVGFPARL